MCEKKDAKKPDSPKYICKKCERLSNKEDNVCKPKKYKQ
jgi:RNA polymerase subunit RPABC4/transcription elongation factor Spt4